MPRLLHLDDDGLTVELRGLLVLGALHRRVRVPWTAIAAVEPASLPAGRGRHGRFRAGRSVRFLTFEDPARAVRIAVDRRADGAPPFDEVVVGHPEPAWLVRQLRHRLPVEAAAFSDRARAA